MLLICTNKIQLKILPKAEFVNREQILQQQQKRVLKSILGQEI
jgi:hypothetical protein